MHKNQKGFSAIEGLLALVAIILLSACGWYVYSHNKKSSQQTTSANTSPAVKGSEARPEPEDKVAQAWTLATSRGGGFSMRIPDGWEVANYNQSDNMRSDQVTYSAGQKATIDTIETAYAGDSLVRFQAVQFKEGDKFKFVYGDEQKTTFSAGGLKGTRYHKTHPLEEMMGVGPIPGEETYTYEFKTAGKTTYVIYRIFNKNQYSEKYLKDNYGQLASDPNQLELVDRVVKTLKIN